MDKNKLKKLHEIGYTILPTCGRCANRNFPDPRSDFGTCSLYDYNHLKHSDNPRKLSIHRSGSCKDGFKADCPGRLGAWEELATDA